MDLGCVYVIQFIYICVYKIQFMIVICFLSAVTLPATRLGLFHRLSERQLTTLDRIRGEGIQGLTLNPWQHIAVMQQGFQRKGPQFGIKGLHDAERRQCINDGPSLLPFCERPLDARWDLARRNRTIFYARNSRKEKLMGNRGGELMEKIMHIQGSRFRIKMNKK